MANLINLQCELDEKENVSLSDNNSDIQENKLTCKMCGYQAIQKTKLKLHHLAVHEGRKYQCNQCDFKTEKKSSLVIHD